MKDVTPNELHEIKLKKIIFKIIGISNYLIQDCENDIELSDTQQLWKALSETIESVLELIQHLYLIKINELEYTDRELQIIKDMKKK